MIGVLRLPLQCHRTRSETHLYPFRKIDPAEEAPLFRVREIFQYHWRGCA